MKRNLIEELIKNKLRKFKEIVENEPELIDYEIISIDEDNYQTACEQIKKKLQEGKVDVMLINKKLSKDIKQISQIDVYKELESQLKKIKFVRYIYFSLLVIFLLAFLLIVYSYITFLKRCGSKAPSVVYIVNTGQVITGHKKSEFSNNTGADIDKNKTSSGALEQTGFSLNTGQKQLMQEEPKIIKEEEELKKIGFKRAINNACLGSGLSILTLNIRRGPDVHYQIIGVLPKGQRVSIYDCGYSKRGYLWYRIKYKNKEGWVWGKGIKKIK